MIPIEDVFVRDRTEFETFDELVAASPSKAGSADELETIPHGEWDEFVAESTAFDGQEAFVVAARTTGSPSGWNWSEPISSRGRASNDRSRRYRYSRRESS